MNIDLHKIQQDAVSSANPEDLVLLNRTLSQRIYELHNIFRISLELTSIVDREQLIYTYMVNILGLLRAAGAILFLPDERNASILRLTHLRGYSKSQLPEISIARPLVDAHLQTQEHNVWPLTGTTAKSLLGTGWEGFASKEIQLLAPFIQTGKAMGMVLLGKKVTGEAYARPDLELLSLINNFMATVLSNIRLIEQLERLSVTDGLTNLMNRRAFDRFLEKEVARCRRYGTRCTLVLFDIDHFKTYNDNNGHPAGDELLRTFSSLLTRSIRKTDYAARYGGEEFAAVLTGVDARGAAAFCERFRALIQKYPFPGAASQPLGFVSASFGLASCPADALEAAALVQCADEALYRAKSAGRNRISTCTPIRRERRTILASSS